MIAIRLCMIFGGAVMMSALLADVRPDRVVRLDFGAAAAGGRRRPAPRGPPCALAVPVICSLSLSASFSASA